MGKTIPPKMALAPKTKKNQIKPPVGNVDAAEYRLILNMKAAGLGFTDIQYITGRSSETISNNSLKILPRLPVDRDGQRQLQQQPY